MDDQELNQTPSDLTDQLEKMIRKLSKEDQVDLFNELRSREGDDRRASNRKHFFNEITFSSARGGHNEFTRDISEDGLFIETHTPFEVGEKLSITFPDKAHSEHIKLSGEIVRVTDAGIGVIFHPLDKAKQTLLKNLLDVL